VEADLSTSRRDADRDRWRGEGVHVEHVVEELHRLHRVHTRRGRGHALTRTLNLIVAPRSPAAEESVDAALRRLETHSPSRTLILRRHDADRLDAEAGIECELWDAAGRVGFCHDQVTLTGDDSRLGHAASLLAPLLLPDLPTVLWLPQPAAPPSDPLLLERAQQILVDSTRDVASVRSLASLTGSVRVHDLTWGRLEFWRAATAAAFDSPERLELPRVDRFEVRYEGDAIAPALLLAGWISARAGWRPERIDLDGGRARGSIARPDGGSVALSLEPDPDARGCGGVETLTLRAGSEVVELRRGAATNRLRDLFAEALPPLASFARGYADAVRFAAAMLDGEPSSSRA
jgi:glucose-6-phosphate dehydrogenase assembly protein OpcA